MSGLMAGARCEAFVFFFKDGSRSFTFGARSLGEAVSEQVTYKILNIGQSDPVRLINK